jgi:hypothetical protein
MPDTVPGKWGQRNAAIELCSKPVSRGVYAGERLSRGGTGKLHRDSHGRQPGSRDATVRDDKGGVRKRELWSRLHGHVPRKRRNSQAFS